jgi:putative CocE/NonD family hydrolase
MSWALLQLTLANFKNVSGVQGVPRERRGQLIQAIDNMTEGFGFLPTKDFPELDSGLAKYYYDWLAHPDFDDYWRKICIEDQHSEIEVPALHTGGWYDIFLGGTIRNYLGMKKSGANETARSGQRLVIGPWAHGARGSTMAGRHYFGIMADPAATDIDGMHLRWFDHWLNARGPNDEKNGIVDEAPVRIFVMGDDVWREEQEWPLARAQETKYYLHSGGKANSKNGDGSLGTDSPQAEPPDVFLYNPADPVPTTGGALCCNPYYAANGAYDQNEVEERQDVLVYSTPPLERDVEVTGPVKVVLWASTSATDTDFTAKLVDVCENGCARNLTDGIIRARYRDSMSDPTLLEPGRAYRYEIDLWATSNVFKAGHRIRLEISSSNFPRFDRNTNTGNIIAEDTELRPALQTVFHEGQQASYVSLAIVPR